MQQFALKKTDFEKFFNDTIKNYEFISTVKENKSKNINRPYFKKITDQNDIYLKKKSYFPVKNFFFHKDETIFEFDKDKLKETIPKVDPTVYFGLRRCDLNGIWHQDIVFLGENADPYYKARRDASLLIGYHCKEGDDYCFCNSFPLTDFFDLMFYEKEDYYGIEIGSKKGEEFIRSSKLFKEKKGFITENDKKIKNSKKLNTLEMKKHYHDKIWKKGSDKCVSCGACNFLCPNCHCFDFKDEVDFSLTKGKRVRNPASCQLRSFTRVAGDHIFRDSRLARFKHRIYHQIQYFKDRHNVIFCTGCGRCIEGCPNKIDWVDIINKIR